MRTKSIFHGALLGFLLCCLFALSCYGEATPSGTFVQLLAFAS
jgi:hypothetical protein